MLSIDSKLMLWALVDIAFYVQGVMIQKFEDDIEKMTAKC